MRQNGCGWEEFSYSGRNCARNYSAPAGRNRTKAWGFRKVRNCAKRLVRAVRERAGDQNGAYEPDILRGDEQAGLVGAQTNAAGSGPDDDGADAEEKHGCVRGTGEDALVSDHPALFQPWQLDSFAALHRGFVRANSRHGPVGRPARVNLRLPLLDDGPDELVRKVRVRSAVAGALDE